MLGTQPMPVSKFGRRAAAEARRQAQREGAARDARAASARKYPTFSFNMDHDLLMRPRAERPRSPGYTAADTKKMFDHGLFGVDKLADVAERYRQLTKYGVRGFDLNVPADAMGYKAATRTKRFEVKEFV